MSAKSTPHTFFAKKVPYFSLMKTPPLARKQKVYIGIEEQSRMQLNVNDFDDFTTVRLFCSSQSTSIYRMMMKET